VFSVCKRARFNCETLRVQEKGMVKKKTVLFIHVIVVGLIVVSYCTTMVELASTASGEGGQNESQLVEGSDFLFHGRRG
jgi:hypothetical protein